MTELPDLADTLDPDRNLHPTVKAAWMRARPLFERYARAHAAALEEKVEKMRVALMMCRDELTRTFMGDLTADERAEAIRCADAALADNQGTAMQPAGLVNGEP
jgi:hypothetical protein